MWLWSPIEVRVQPHAWLLSHTFESITTYFLSLGDTVKFLSSLATHICMTYSSRCKTWLQSFPGHSPSFADCEFPKAATYTATYLADIHSFQAPKTCMAALSFSLGLCHMLSWSQVLSELVTSLASFKRFGDCGTCLAAF